MDIRTAELREKTNDVVETDFTKICGNIAPSISIFKYWTAEVKRGRKRMSVEDRPNRLNEVTTSGMIEKFTIQASCKKNVRIWRR